VDKSGTSGGEVVGPHPELIPLLEQHGLTWEVFRKRGRPAKGISERRRAVIRDLQVTGYSWADMVEITGTSQGFIQRNRDTCVSLRPEQVFLTCAWCGDGFRDSPSNVRRKQARGQIDFYCSRECRGKGYSASKDVSLVCGTCGEQFTRKAGVVSAGERRGQKKMFCSRSCANAGLIKPYRVQDEALFDYLAGVVCGDGSVHLVEGGGGGGSVVAISVGFKDIEYVGVLYQVVEQVFGFDPTKQENQKARAISVNLCGIEAARLFGMIKTSDGWVLDGIQYPGEFIAGLCDTDGGWPKKRGSDTRRAFTISQKDNGNLERTLPLWSAVGLHPTIRPYVNKKTGYRRVVLRVRAGEIDRFKERVPLRHPRKRVAARWFGIHPIAGSE